MQRDQLRRLDQHPPIYPGPVISLQVLYACHVILPPVCWPVWIILVCDCVHHLLEALLLPCLSTRGVGFSTPFFYQRSHQESLHPATICGPDPPLPTQVSCYPFLPFLVVGVIAQRTDRKQRGTVSWA